MTAFEPDRPAIVQRLPIGILAGLLGGAVTFMVEVSLRLPYLYFFTLETAPVGYLAVFAAYTLCGAAAGLGGVVGWALLRGLWARARRRHRAVILALVAVAFLAGVVPFLRIIGRTELGLADVGAHLATVFAGLVLFSTVTAVLVRAIGRKGPRRVALVWGLAIGILGTSHTVWIKALSLDRVLASIPEPTAASPSPNVLLVTPDTLRADRLGAYGYRQDISPHIDRLAREGTLFERAYSQSSWTRSSFGSLLTSKYPTQHGAFVVQDPALGGFHRTWGDMLYNQGLSDDVKTMAEIFQEQGYSTVCVQTNWQVTEAQNFTQGFDVFLYHTLYTVPLWDRTLLGIYGSWLPELFGASRRLSFEHAKAPDAADVHRVLEPMLRGRLRSPFFLWINYMDPHDPYHVRDESVALDSAPITAEFDSWDMATPASVLSGAYDAEVRYLDHFFGKLYDLLQETGHLDNTIIVFTSDHGEDFEDHSIEVRLGDGTLARGRHHGHSLYNELLSVPLIIRYPSAVPAGKRVASLARSIDVLPTILELAGFEAATVADSMEGQSLATGITSGGSDQDPGLSFSERLYFGLEWKAVQDSRYKLILRTADGSEEFYDLEQDPREQNDLSAHASPEADRLRQELARWMARMAESSPDLADSERRQLQRDELEKLRALGYIQ